MQKIIKRTLSCLLSFSLTVGAASMLSVSGGASTARYGDIDGCFGCAETQRRCCGAFK